MKNENIIQVGGKSYIKSKVMALPTEKATSLYFDALTKKVLQNDLIELYKGDKAYSNFEPRHLYFLSDEKIKDEDLVLHKNRVHRVSKNRGLYLSVYEFTNIDIRTDFCKKIIAATDESIGDSLKALPRPSNEFLEAYCKANGKIEEVLVEVEQGNWIFERSSGYVGYRCQDCAEWIYENQPKQCKCKCKLKVAPDNTITIRKVDAMVLSSDGNKYTVNGRDLYDREEVAGFIYSFAGKNGLGSSHADKFIQDNLR